MGRRYWKQQQASRFFREETAMTLTTRPTTRRRWTDTQNPTKVSCGSKREVRSTLWPLPLFLRKRKKMLRCRERPVRGHGGGRRADANKPKANEDRRACFPPDAHSRLFAKPFHRFREEFRGERRRASRLAPCRVVGIGIPELDLASHGRFQPGKDVVAYAACRRPARHEFGFR